MLCSYCESNLNYSLRNFCFEIKKSKKNIKVCLVYSLFVQREREGDWDKKRENLLNDIVIYLKKKQLEREIPDWNSISA